ncbi:universal stress protein [Nocardia goodfellowii]|uniref:Nucleotide-binding universal stress UspA family protein n=1 Tax=Nocardia goodfellowii TaxID=882446 RepID=A0ABS4QIH3_9NOCA|nr:universal stress protein [Nocardia goodfellowii]MBP2191383.1 nucleotide-binding universal stress UspA family protein [Nocardia goodfellowii]
MSTRPDDPHRLASAPIVVGTDGSEGAERAVRWAAEIAARRGRRLLIAHGLDIAASQALIAASGIVAPVGQITGARAERVLDSARRLALLAAPGIEIETETSDLSPGKLLVELSESANLVVLGGTGRAGTLAHLGSTVLAVTSRGHGDIVVIRAAPGQEPRTSGPVVVGVDGGPVSSAAVATAFAAAAERGTDLVAVHCWSEWHYGEILDEARAAALQKTLEAEEDAVLAERLAGWSEKYPDVQLTRDVSVSGPTDRLLHWSTSAQLVVVGSRGRGGFRGLLLGSTSSFLVQRAECPVLVAHP